MHVAQKTGGILRCGEDYMILLPYYEYEILEQTNTFKYHYSIVEIECLLNSAPIKRFYTLGVVVKFFET